jgi:hypothetical protein
MCDLIKLDYSKERIEMNITKIAACEKVTKATLSILSRDLLAYVYETNDIAMVNRLLKVLSPVNKRVAEEYFPKYLGWTFNKKELTFGTKAKDKAHTAKYELTCAWLGDITNDIWVFAKQEIVFAVAPKKYASKITQLVTRALKDAEEGISVKDIMYAIMASELVTLNDILAPLAEIPATIDAVELPVIKDLDVAA